MIQQRKVSIQKFPQRCWLSCLVLLLSVCGCAPNQQSADNYDASVVDSRLDRIRDANVIRVGTTGDFMPFSYADKTSGDLRGIDIELARDLSSALGVRVKFVATSWPTLMQDLLADRFDVGMGGITITEERKAHANFSIPTYAGGKVAIARAGDATRFHTVDAINQPGVRVIVNPGGTNEAFARARLPLANLILNGENLTVFDKIISGEADVMVTDAIEARIQASIHPELQAANMDAPFNQFEFGYLLPRDDALKGFVDGWLAGLQADGRYQRYFEAELQRIQAVLVPHE